MQKYISNLNNRSHEKYLQHSKIPPMLDSSLKRTKPRHLELESFSDERTSSLDFIVPDPYEIDILGMQLAEQEAIDRRLQKEREEKIMKAFEEKKTFLRRIAALKQKNEVSTSAWKLEIIG